MHPLILFALFFIPDIQSSGSMSVKKMLEYPSMVRYRNYGHPYPDSRTYSRVTTDENEHNPDARTIFIPLEDAESGISGGITYTTVTQNLDKSSKIQNEFYIESFSIHGLQSPKSKSVPKTNKSNYSPQIFADTREREDINEKQHHKELGHNGKGKDKMKHNVKTNKMIYNPHPFFESLTNEDIKHNTIESSEPSSFKTSGPSEVIDNVLGDKDENIDWTFPEFEDAEKAMEEHFSIFNKEMNSNDMNMDDELSFNSPSLDSPHLEVKNDGYDIVEFHTPIDNEMDFNHHGLTNLKKRNDELSANSHSLRGSSQRDTKDDGFENVDFEFPNGNKMDFSHHGSMKIIDDEPTATNHFLRDVSQLDFKEDEYENNENGHKMVFNHHGLTNQKKVDDELSVNGQSSRSSSQRNTKDDGFEDIDFEFPNGNKMDFSHHGSMKIMDDEPTATNNFLRGVPQLDFNEDDYKNGHKMVFNHHGLTNLHPDLEIKPFENKIESYPVKLHDNLFTNAEELNFNDFHDSGDADIFKNNDVRHQNYKFPKIDKEVERDLTDYDDFTAPFIAKEKEFKYDDFEFPEHSKSNRESFISNNNNMKSDKETDNFESVNPSFDYFDFFDALPEPTTTPMPQTTPMPDFSPIPPPPTFNWISSHQAPQPDNEELYEDTETAIPHHETSEKEQHEVDEESFWQKLHNGSYSSYISKLINPLMNNLRNML